MAEEREELLIVREGADSRRTEARRALQERINYYVGQQYRVVSQTDFSAQLVKPKRFSFLWFLFWSIISFGIGLILYPGYHIFLKRERQVYLTVDERGHIQETSHKR